MDYEVVLLAAGKGKRMGVGKNKLFLELNKIPIIVYTIKRFQEDHHCKNIILVVSTDDMDSMSALLVEYQITEKLLLTTGGKERQDSVYCGLQNCTQDIILIHDGARPFIDIMRIQHLVSETYKHKAAIIAVPVKDTIKKTNEHFIEDTMERNSLWAAQTPQAFHVDIIKKAHELARQEEFLGTDDASLVERMGQKVKIVPGSYTNIKITTHEDLIFAQAILSSSK